VQQLFLNKNREKCFGGNGTWSILVGGTILVKKHDFYPDLVKTQETKFFGNISPFDPTTVTA